jgi:hypothetical protein
VNMSGNGEADDDIEMGKIGAHAAMLRLAKRGRCLRRLTCHDNSEGQVSREDKEYCR